MTIKELIESHVFETINIGDVPKGPSPVFLLRASEHCHEQGAR